MAETPTPVVIPVVPTTMQPWLVTILLALIGSIQVIAVAYIGSDISAKVDTTTQQVIKMERQINSNMERQIKEAIDGAVARERLRVIMGDRTDTPEAIRQREAETKEHAKTARDLVNKLSCLDGKSPITGAPCKPSDAD